MDYIKRSPGMQAALKGLDGELKALQAERKQGVMAGVAKIAQAVTAFDGVVTNRAPSDTAEAHIMRVHRAAKTLRDQIEKARDSHLQFRGQLYANLFEAMVEKAQLKDSAYGREIRDIYRSMDEDQRAKFLVEATSRKQLEVVGALLGVPHYLSGMNEDTHKEATDSFLSDVAPDLAAQMEEILQTDRVLNAVLKEAQVSVMDGLHLDDIKSIADREEKAENARAVFEAEARG